MAPKVDSEVPSASSVNLNDFNRTVAIPGMENIKAADLKFFHYGNDYSFSLFAVEFEDDGKVRLDDKGKSIPVYSTDRDGNNRIRKEERFHFTRVPVIDVNTKKTSAMEMLSYFIVPLGHPRRTDLLKYLYDACKHPVTGIVTEEEYHKRRNPEAFRIAQERQQDKGRVSELETLNAELQAKLQAIEKGSNGQNNQQGRNNRG